MRLLSPLALGLILTGLMIFLPWVTLDLSCDSSQSLVGEVDRVGTHVGDMPRLVEGLR